VDGAENGPAPLPWDINAQPSDVFKNEEKFIRVPHTSSVKHCHRCRGAGHVVCTECYGKGWVGIKIDCVLKVEVKNSYLLHSNLVVWHLTSDSKPDYLKLYWLV
jgi:hypothetical protein